jgi:hypothetical protein
MIDLRVHLFPSYDGFRIFVKCYKCCVTYWLVAAAYFARNKVCLNFIKFVIGIIIPVSAFDVSESVCR